MSESKANQCEFHLIKAWMPVSKPYLKASVKSITDLKIEGIDGNKYIKHMAKIPGNRYISITYESRSYKHTLDIIDDHLMTAKKLMNTSNAFSVTINLDLILVSRGNNPISVIRGNQVIGALETTIKCLQCKRGFYINDRWIAQFNDDLFVLNNNNNLYSFKWSDIHAGIYSNKSLVAVQIKHFLPTDQGVAVLTSLDRLTLPGIFDADLDECKTFTDWSIVIKAGKHWIVSGDLDGQAIIASINGSGKVKSTLNILMTSNGYDTDEYTSMHSLTIARASKYYHVLLATEVEGCMHMILVNRYGVVSILNKIDNILCPQDDCKNMVVKSVTETYRKGEFIVSGYNSLKRMRLRLNYV
jgi:hypothetical protein